MFPVACLPLLLPGSDAFDDPVLAAIVGGGVALLGQVVRILTIGLRYVIRGGRARRIYAEDLVTEGLYAHTRNPMYVGNILIVAGVAVASNSWTTIMVGVPLGAALYICIVAAEEQFLLQRFGNAFRDYCRNTPRWLPRLEGLRHTVSSMQFRWRRVVVKEYGTPFGWVMIILAVTSFNLWAAGKWVAHPVAFEAILGVAVVTIGLWFIAWRLKRARVLVAD